MSNLYIGLMSGTSSDSIDAALVEIPENSNNLRLIAAHNEPIEAPIKKAIRELSQHDQVSLDDVGQLDRQVGLLFAKATKNLLTRFSIDSKAITAIGSHGQTIRHAPKLSFPYTLQLGDPHTIAHETGITTVADFRRRDIAAGGQGAPLVPAFHQAIFRTNARSRIILNIGGIANITVLPKHQLEPIIGFDTGPGNTLIDQWAQKYFDQSFDNNGEIAAKGTLQYKLLNHLLEDPYFKLRPPKSTGPDYFNLSWLATKIEENSQNHHNILHTLTMFTAKTIANAIRQFNVDEIFVCGGGIHNHTLMRLLRQELPSIPIESTLGLGVDPDWVEALAFAWLARQTLNKQPGNLPSVTGASSSCILGAICYP